MSNPIIQTQHLEEYQDQPDNLRALIALAADGTGVNSISNNVGYWNATGTFTGIFTPAALANDPRMVASRDYGFFLDGVLADQFKWHVVNGRSKWGIAAPTVAPSIASTVPTATDTWQGSTEYTTLGLLVDSNNNIQQINSINADGTNGNPSPAHIGTTGVGSPNWNQTTGGTTSDNTITWTNRGPIGLWQPNHLYNNESAGVGSVANPSFIYDPATNSIYENANGGNRAGTSGATRPKFTGINGQFVADNGGDNGGPPATNGIAWFCISPANDVWLPSHAYTNVSHDERNTQITEPTNCKTAYDSVNNVFKQTIYMQRIGSNGTSAASYANPGWATQVGAFTSDKQILWQCQGTKTWAPMTQYNAFVGIGTAFGVVVDSISGTFQACLQGGTSGSGPAPTFNSNYGDQTADGTVTWVCLGPTVSWVASRKWFLGPSGFTVPNSAGSYGGATIADSNNNVQTVIASGESFTSAPTWSTSALGQTSDPGTPAITWLNLGAVSGTGGTAVTLTKGRQYFLVYTNTTSGGISDLGPVSGSSGPIAGGSVFLGNLQASADTQVDKKILLATADGGNQTTLFFVAILPNAQTTYVDNLSETLLNAGLVYQETQSDGTLHGVFRNQPPPNGSFPIKHRGRLWLLQNSFLFFSKSLNDVTTSTGTICGRYEECWPPSYQFDISEGAEIGRGLYSDGSILYIGTQRHIRRIQGYDTTNFTSPEIIFNEVGLMNQDVWQGIYINGTPVGTMWITPDFRCIKSDFNVYENVGLPIQSTLNTINPAAQNACWAAFVGIGAYNLYVLAIPTGTNTTPDTLCVYNIQTGRWFIWNTADKLRSGLYYMNLAGIPRFVINAQDGSIYLFDPAMVMDRQTGADKVGITSTIRTSFNDLTDATMRKAMNEVEVATTQPNLAVTVEGASSAATFATPNVVVAGAVPIVNFLGDKKVYLCGLTSTDRFYRVTFSDTSTINSSVDDEILSYYSLEAVPLHRI